MTPQLEIDNQELQTNEPDTEMSWITDGEGNISNQGHYTFYTLVGSAIFIIFIVVCFHSEIKRICDCMIPKRKFRPEITYKADPEQIIIAQQSVTPTERSFKNRGGQERKLPPNDPNIPEEKKGVSADKVPGCPTSAENTVPGAPTPILKTTNIKSTCDLASTETRKKGAVRWVFPDVKRQEKQ